MFGKRLLIWDSYRCHICDEVKASCKKNNIDMIVIPGGCTKFLQTLDVSANKPFKAAVMEQFDEWMDKGKKSYTRHGNLRAASKTTMCDWVVKAWSGIGTELVKKNFVACGQVANAKIEILTV